MSTKNSYLSWGSPKKKKAQKEEELDSDDEYSEYLDEFMETVDQLPFIGDEIEDGTYNSKMLSEDIINIIRDIYSKTGFRLFPDYETLEEIGQAKFDNNKKAIKIWLEGTGRMVDSRDKRIGIADKIRDLTKTFEEQEAKQFESKYNRKFDEPESMAIDLKMLGIKKKKKSSPKKKSPTPKKKSPTPKKKSPTPKKKSPTPKKRTPTPKKRTPTPKKRTPTPVYGPMSPAYSPTSPVYHNSPQKKKHPRILPKFLLDSYRKKKSHSRKRTPVKHGPKPPCPHGKYRSGTTGRCKKDRRKPCPPGWERNNETNRCFQKKKSPSAHRRRTPSAHRSPSPHKRRTPSVHKHHRSPSNSPIRPCPPGKYRNSKTGRCKKDKRKPCPPGKSRNVKTNRCSKNK